MRAIIRTLLLFTTISLAYVVNNGTSCYLYPESLIYHGPVDDTPSIVQAFELCGTNGSVIFTDNHFHINQVMNTTNLVNCDVSIYGYLEWGTNVPYWLSYSYNLVFQNQSTAWLFGGTNVTMRGYGKGQFFSNGQVWYDENMSNSNQPGRPIPIAFYNATNLFVDGLSWIQTSFWNSFILHSKNVTMTNIYMHATSDNGNSTVNTDGTDTWNSDQVYLANWTVTNGDDCIALKGNSTNIHINNVTCYGGGCMPIGSIGQYPGMPDYVVNVTFENVVCHNTSNAAWIKTWQGKSTGASQNGDAGGGGGGLVRNVTFRNFQIHNVSVPIYVTQCTYENDPSVCDTSQLQLQDITWQNITGTSAYDVAASLHCSSMVPCPGLRFFDVDIVPWNKSVGLPSPRTVYQCANLVGQNATGPNSTGIKCNEWAPNNFPARIDRNY